MAVKTHVGVFLFHGLHSVRIFQQFVQFAERHKPVMSSMLRRCVELQIDFTLLRRRASTSSFKGWRFMKPAAFQVTATTRDVFEEYTFVCQSGSRNQVHVFRGSHVS